MSSPSESFLVRALTQLSHAANATDASGIVTELAKLVNGWAVIIDRSGSPAGASGASRIHIGDAVAAAAGRHRDVRTKDLQRFPVGQPSDPRAYLIVAAKGRSVSEVTVMAEHATALISLIGDPLRSSRLESIARADAVELLLSKDAGLARRCAARWGMPGELFTVIGFGATSRALMMESVVAEWTRSIGAVECMTQDREGLWLVLDDRSVDSLVAHARDRWADGGSGFHCGVGRAYPLGELGSSRAQAKVALGVAIADRAAVQIFDDLPTVGTLLRSLTPDMRDTLRAPLKTLSALTEEVRAELLQCAQVFLATNGGWEASAAQLRVHRHTIRARISRLEELTGLSMSNSDDRVALLLALRSEADAR